MSRIETLDTDGILSRLADLQSTLTDLVNAQASTDAVTYAPIAEPIAVAERAARIAAIAQEVTDRNNAIANETAWRDIAVQAATVHTVINARRAASNVSITSTAAWVNVDTATDLVIPAAAGDLLEVTVSGVWGTEAPVGFLDVVSIVAGNPVNSWAANGAVVTNPATVQGVMGWRGEASNYCGFGGSVSKRVVAGDISGGNVTLRFRAAISVAGTKTFYGTTINPFQCHVKNLRQG